MIRTAKKLAACVLMLGVLVCGTALSAAAASLPVEEQNGVSLPWLKDVPAESIATGSYSANMLLGASQQLSPVVSPSYSTDSVVFLTDDSSVLTVSSSGVVQAVGVGTATVTAAAGNQICAYTIVVSMDSSMIVTEMDLSLSSNTIYVGNSVSASLQVRPSSASNYATVTLTSSNEKIATVNSFGRVTGVAPGKATITATCGSVVATTTVTVLTLPTDSSTGTSGTTSNNSGQVITPNTNYIVLKPGATRTITAKATPASASQSFTFKSGNSSIATVSPTGVVTAVGTGSTSITISNGKATAMVTVIVNRSADAASGSDSSNDGTNTPDDNTTIPLDPVVQTIQDSTEDQVVFAQSEVPIVTGEILNTLRTTGKTLCVVGDGYTLNVSGKDVKSTTSEIDTAITFTESEEGLEFELDNGRTLPCAVQLELDVSTIHSRVSWMLSPVERSIKVSPPHLQDHTALSTSSSMLEVVAELPMLVLIFTRKLRPMIIGSLSGWLMLAGRTARPRAISSRTYSGVIWVSMPNSWQFMFSRIATYSISGVMMPALA